MYSFSASPKIDFYSDEIIECARAFYIQYIEHPLKFISVLHASIF